MGVTGGIAAGLGRGGPYRPELEVVFLCETLDDVEFFVGFGQHPLVDVWAVDVTGLPIEPGPDGWVLCREPIRRNGSGCCTQTGRPHDLSCAPCGCRS